MLTVNKAKLYLAIHLIPAIKMLGMAGLFSALLLTDGCDISDQAIVASPIEFRGPTMGTNYVVKILAVPTGITTDQLDRNIAQVLERLNNLMTTYSPKSEVSRFSMYPNTDWFPVSADVCAIVADALRISRLSNGTFDITVEPLVDLWGFGPSSPRSKAPSEQEIAAAMQRVGYQHLHTRCDDKPALRKDRPDIAIDLSAIAQGYGTDRVADLLDNLGIKDYMVDVGGELRGRGLNPKGKPWRVGIERPLPGLMEVVDRVIEIKDVAVATSGTYRNFFDDQGIRYSHTLDPQTGKPVKHNLVSVTVITKKATDADGLATALLVLGPERGYKLALQEHLAVIFIIYDGKGLVEKLTPAAASY